MRTISIEISSARSVEDAMEKAIVEAESKCEPHSDDPKKWTRLSKVSFKGLEVSPEYRDNHWSYKFEAELEEM